jgi:hypothetical protein
VRACNFVPQLRGRTRIEGAGKDAEEKIYWNCDGRCKRKQMNIQ